MATKFKNQDKVRLTQAVRGHGPEKVWTVLQTVLGFESNSVQVAYQGGVYTFSEDVLELVNQRVEGKKIDPRDVKIGDVILTTYTTAAGNVFTRKGQVDEKKTLFGGGYVLSANGQDLYNVNWSHVKADPTVELVTAVREPHALELAKPGDYFKLERQIKFSEPGSVRYTKLRERRWLEEQLSPSGIQQMIYILPESDVRSVFDGHAAKLVTV